jgi:hypothetical protein
MNGIPLTIIQQQLGHANANATSKYLQQLAPRDVVVALRALPPGRDGGVAVGVRVYRRVGKHGAQPAQPAQLVQPGGLSADPGSHLRGDYPLRRSPASIWRSVSTPVLSASRRERGNRVPAEPASVGHAGRKCFHERFHRPASTSQNPTRPP